LIGSIRKPTYTRPLPDGAEVFIFKGKQFVRWTDGKTIKRIVKPIGKG
jgi:hypothetical protein